MSISFNGYFTHLHDQAVLVYGPAAANLGQVRNGPPLSLRPGYLLYTRNTYLLPHTIIDDLGQQFDPPACYAWIEAHGGLYPRADVVGHLPSGEVQTVFLKELDLVEMAVFVARSPNPYPRVTLALEVHATPEAPALAPQPFPTALFARALPTYQVAAPLLTTVGAALIQRLRTSPPFQPMPTLEQVLAWLDL